jgi:hypothetical protein
MSFVRNVAMAAPFFFAQVATAEIVTYGSLHYNSDLPHVLFLTGRIKSGDSFELRRAMRDQDIKLIVASSPGGNLYEGLQIAAILDDNEIGTYIPEGASCESSCANIFLGGFARLLVGDLGVHQFYSGGADADSAASKSETTASTQYTTSDIIGIMNQFDTPPFVYEKMFGTTDIYYFNGAQKALLNKGLESVPFTSTVGAVDTFLITSPLEKSRPAPPSAPATVAENPVPTAPSEISEHVALDFLADVNRDWSLPNDQALSRLATYYGANVTFYGKAFSHAGVIADKQAFANRWPIRDYLVESDSIRIDCGSQNCTIESIIAWTAASPARGATASGRSTWRLVVVSSGGSLQIVSEGGRTIKRN